MPRPDPPRTTRRRRAPRRGPGRLTAGAAAIAVAAGVWLIHDGSAETGPPQPPTVASDAGTPSAGAETFPPTAGATAPERPLPAPLSPSVPTRIRIPSIKVDAPMIG